MLLGERREGRRKALEALEERTGGEGGRELWFEIAEEDDDEKALGGC